MRQIRYAYDVAMDAFYTFLADDGWAIASHIALSSLMALFPFLIVLTSLAGFVGSKNLADQAAELMLQIWPVQVADALSVQIHDVLTTTRGDALTIGLLLAIYFASNGVESLRVALNRAYSVVDMRRWYWLRLESIGYTMVAAFTALAMAFLIVLGPLLLETARRYVPLMVESNETLLTVVRYGITITAMTGRAVHPARLAAVRAADLPPDPAGHRVHDGGLAAVRRRLRHVSGAFRQQLRDDVCGAGVGDHRAGVSVFHRRDLRLRRRTERGDHQIAAAEGRVTSSSAVASARGDTGLSRKASAPAAREAASSSPRPDTPMIATRPAGGSRARGSAGSPRRR